MPELIDVATDLQGLDWTADAIWAHVDTMIQVFKAKGLPPPIVYIHNHAPQQQQVQSSTKFDKVRKKSTKFDKVQ